MNSSSLVFRFLIGLFISLWLILFDRLSYLNWMRAGIERAMRPEVMAANAAAGRADKIYQLARFTHSGPARIADLERRLILAQKQSQDAAGALLGCQSLKEAEGNSPTASMKKNPARVLASGSNFIISHTGSSPGQPVISPEGGLVGVIKKTGRWSDSVRLLTDPDSRLAAQIISAGGAKIAEGELNGVFGASAWVEKILVSAELEAGQTVISAGSDDIVPPGLVIGWIEKIEKEEALVYQRAQVNLAIKPPQTAEVLVISR